MVLFVSGIPLSVHNIRSASRASSDRGGAAGSASVAAGPNYLQKGSRGVLVPASRAGAARAAAILLISCHLTPEQTQQGNSSHLQQPLVHTHTHTHLCPRSYAVVCAYSMFRNLRYFSHVYYFISEIAVSRLNEIFCFVLPINCFTQVLVFRKFMLHHQSQMGFGQVTTVFIRSYLHLYTFLFYLKNEIENRNKKPAHLTVAIRITSLELDPPIHIFMSIFWS